MKTIKNYLLAATTALLFTACGGNSANNGNDSQQDGATESTTASAGKASKGKKYNVKCFEAFDYNYSKMLTKEDVLKHISVSDPDEVEVNFKVRDERYKQYNEYKITWPSDRPDMKMEVNTGTMSMSLPMEDNNIVSFESLEFKRSDADKELAAFNRAYGKLSEQEYREMEERIDKQQADKSEEERKAMKSMVRARENMNFHPVANVGTGAYWEREEVKGIYFGTNLHVLAGTVQFRIKVKVGHDDEENARIAALLAQEVLAKCN